MVVINTLWLASVLLSASLQHVTATCANASLYRNFDGNLLTEDIQADGQIILTPIDSGIALRATYKVDNDGVATFTRVTYRVLDAGVEKVQTAVIDDVTNNVVKINDNDVAADQDMVVDFVPSAVGQKLRFIATPYPGSATFRFQIVSVDRCLGETTTTTEAWTTTPAGAGTCVEPQLYKSFDDNLYTEEVQADGQIVLTPTDPGLDFKATYKIANADFAMFSSVTYRLLDSVPDRVQVIVNHPNDTAITKDTKDNVALDEDTVAQFDPPIPGYKLRFVVRPAAGTSAIRLQIVSIAACLDSSATTPTTPPATTTTAAPTTTFPPTGDPMTDWLNNAPVKKPNVLFMVSDDLRPWLGSYGVDFMVTPNIDQLASKGVRFDNANSQHAVCGPSRASFMTSRRSDTTHVYDLATYWRKAGGNFTTVSQYFKDYGYIAEGLGKIYHKGEAAGGDTYDYPFSWSTEFDVGNTNIDISQTSKDSAVHPVNLTDGKILQDTNIANLAISKLQTYSQNPNQPFFLAVGFKKPHLPFMYPAEYDALYDDVSIPLALNQNLNSSIPGLVWTSFPELRAYDDIAALNLSDDNNWRIPDSKQDELRRGYAAAVSFIDNQVGRILEALTTNGLDQNTIVVFFSDHGFQLGEVGQWTKHNNYETSVRVPLLVRVPGVTDNNDGFSHIDLFNNPPSPPASTQYTPRPVELVDLFPTLAELAGLPVPGTCPLDSANIETCMEGVSLVELIREATGGAAASWKDIAFSQYPRRYDPGRMGYTLRTRQYRYVEWVSFNYTTNQADFNDVQYRQLYLHDVNLDGNDADPEEANNKVEDPAYASVVADLGTKLRDNWLVALQNM